MFVFARHADIIVEPESKLQTADKPAPERMIDLQADIAPELREELRRVLEDK